MAFKMKGAPYPKRTKTFTTDASGGVQKTVTRTSKKGDIKSKKVVDYDASGTRTKKTRKGWRGTKTVEGKREFLRNLISYYIVCEGTFFFSGFAMLLALGRQNKLPGLSDQIRYTLRDESLHIQFGTYLINTIKKQYPSVWTKKFEAETVEHIKKAVELEVLYANDVLPRGILGLNADMFVDYMQYIGNRRLEGIGINFQFDSDQNPFPWLSEVVDIGAMTNFFERKVKDYQNSGTLEDDF